MVSKASEDFPDPLSPVITVKVFRGISTSMFFRLCWRAPCTVIRSSIGRDHFYFSLLPPAGNVLALVLKLFHRCAGGTVISTVLPSSCGNSFMQPYWKSLMQFDLSDILFIAVVLSIAIAIINSSGGGGHRSPVRI